MYIYVYMTKNMCPYVLPTQPPPLLSLTRSPPLLPVTINPYPQGYRVPWQRIAAWRDNPTVYRYGYLWAVHSLYYWWRDQGLAEQGSVTAESSPCYLNRYIYMP